MGQALCVAIRKRMEQKNGPWTIRYTESKYNDEHIEVFVDTVKKPNGEPGTYATVQLKRGVAVLPMDAAGNVYLTRQFRYAIGQESIEVISGGVEKGEKPLVAAQREAKEELGIEGTDWIEMGYFHLETSIIKGPVYLYLLRGVSFTDTDPDDTEDIKRLKLSLEEATKKVRGNEITHGPSCVLILKAILQQHETARVQ